MITWKTIAALAAALLLVRFAGAAENPPSARVAPLAVGQNVPAVCVVPDYCYKTPPCVKCPPTGGYYACYDRKPMPCIKCPPCGNYYAPYCGKPSPVCGPMPPVKTCCCPPCRHPCD